MVQAEFGWRRLAGLFDDLFAAPARLPSPHDPTRWRAAATAEESGRRIKKRRRFDAVLPAPKGVEERHNALGAIGSARRSTTTACRRPARRCATAAPACWSDARRAGTRTKRRQQLVDAGRGDVRLIPVQWPNSLIRLYVEEVGNPPHFPVAIVQ